MYHNHTKCLACGAPDTTCVSIKSIPIGAQYFSSEPNLLENEDRLLFQCRVCQHVFFSEPPVTYYKQVIRSVGFSPAMMSMRDHQFKTIRHQYFPANLLLRTLEIGSGTGDYASLLQQAFGTCIATESDYTSRFIRCPDITFVDTHPDEDCFIADLKDYAPFDAIFSFSYLEHLKDPLLTLKKASCLLADHGLLCIEVPDTRQILSHNLVNELIPDHIHYFNAYSLQLLARRAGFQLVSLDTIWDGYITTAIFKKLLNNSIGSFPAAQEAFKSDVESTLSSFSNHDTIAVWGAGHQALFAINSTSLAQRISYIVDSSTFKQGQYTPASNIPIFSPQYLYDDPPQLLIIACAGYNYEVLGAVRGMDIKCELAILNANTIELL